MSLSEQLASNRVQCKQVVHEAMEFHSGSIYAIAWHPSGAIIATGKGLTCRNWHLASAVKFRVAERVHWKPSDLDLW